jgi:APA family basic amino acid/polyamine antiporter
VGDRRLSLFDATLLVMGGSIGVGIFFTPQSVAKLLPASGPFFGLWALGGLLALAGALTFAELAASFPQAGGWYVYLREAFGRPTAFLFAWVVLIVVSTGASAVIGDFCATQIELLAFGGPASPGVHLALGFALIAAITAIALTGVKSGALLQDACMLLKAGALLAIIGGAFLLAEPAAPAVASAGNWTGADVVRAALPVLFAYGGWHIATYLGHTIRDPARNLPRAMVAGTLGTIALYLLVNGAFVRVLGMEGLATTEGFAGVVARRTLGGAGGTLLIAAMAVSSFGVCITILLGSPWVYVAMARDGLFFRAVGAVSPRTGAPVNALLLQAALATGYLAWGRAGTVTDAVVFAEWIFHAQCGFALMRLRARRPELPRPFRSPLYPLAPLLYSGLAALLVVGAIVFAEPWKTGLGLGVLAAGGVAYVTWRKLAPAGGEVAARDTHAPPPPRVSGRR